MLRGNPMKVRKTLVALGAAATLSLTACGNAEDVVGVDSSVGGDSAAAQASGALTQDTFASSVSDAQSKAQTAHLEMDIEASGMEISGSGDMAMDPESDDPKDSKMAMTMEMPMIGDLEMRLVDGIAYVNMGSYTQDKFATFDLTDDSNPLGTSLDEITKQADPNAMVKQLSGSLKDFEKTDETEEIDGVEATKYELTMDGSELGGMMQQAEGSSLSGGSVDMPKKVVAYVWIGDDDLLRKMTMDLDSGSMPMSMEMTFTKWGEPVEVEAPPADETIDGSELDLGTTM
ncbi:LppX_LprAFG lipoprotein [Solicola gregarius]|uniref:LppX_LprAFG lipoprotein n=1 Tax=Solicola gregarius TaxID=2908642 RepID=A0AA46YJ16_9ACTN|nr:LppX_LprAFG lipoprotein [Solicola gregarius]UYM03717.1 LppX_LprAFG lipoprotein [Solicola gregarius]